MIGMASNEARKQANKQKGKQARKQTKGGVYQGQMFTLRAQLVLKFQVNVISPPSLKSEHIWSFS